MRLTRGRAALSPASQLEKAKQLATDNPDLIAYGLTDEALEKMAATIDTMPQAAVQVLVSRAWGAFQDSRR